MGLFADGAERHGAGAEPFHNHLHRFYFRNVDGIPFVVEQVADKGRPLLLIDQRCILFKQLVIICPGRYLKFGYSFRIPRVVFSFNPVGIVSQVSKTEGFIVLFTECFGERLEHFAGNVFHIYSFYLGRYILKIVIQYR